MGSNDMAAATPAATSYPEGAMVRVKEICRDSKTGRAGLLPIVPRTWHLWVAAGRVPAGRKIGNTRVWPVSDVLAIGGQQ